MIHKNILMYCFCIISSFISMGKNFHFIIRVHSLSFIACWLLQRLTGNIVAKSQGLGVVNSFQSTFSIARSVVSWASWFQCTQNILIQTSFAAFLLCGSFLMSPGSMKIWKRPFYCIWSLCFIPGQRSPALNFDLSK